MMSQQTHAFADGSGPLLRRSTKFVVALAVIASTLVLTAVTERLLGTASGALFAFAVCICAGIFGLLPGLFAAGAAALVLDFFYMPPAYRLDSGFFREVLLLSGLAGITYFARGQRLGLLTRSVNSKLFSRRVNSVQAIAPAKFQGKGALDGVNEGELYGWAFNTAEPGKRLVVTVYVNRRPVTRLVPVHLREDVAVALGCPWHVGFYVDLFKHANVKPGESVEVDARLENGVSLVNAPRIVQVPASRPRQHRSTVLFMHIPKTAGTAFREYIASNFLYSEVAYLYPSLPGIPGGNLHSLPLDQRRGFRAVIGHYQFGVHECLPQESEYITIVREPASRTISQYAFLHETDPDFLRRSDRTAISLIELLERKLTVDFDNPMVRCFSGVWEGDLPPGSISADVLALAIKNLHECFAFVGHQEQSDEAFLKLRQRYGWDAQDSLCSVNRSKVTVRERTAGEGTLSAIRHYNRWDYLLYDEILKTYPRSAVVSNSTTN
jgi:hypothetical protein